jgi:hypothetical protein
MDTDIPDFTKWSTRRLEVLLDDYRESLAGIRVLYGVGPQRDKESALYQKWCTAIEAELDRRTRT